MSGKHEENFFLLSLPKGLLIPALLDGPQNKGPEESPEEDPGKEHKYKRRSEIRTKPVKTMANKLVNLIASY